MADNAKWLAYANTKKFDIVSCMEELGMTFWKMQTRNFNVGDIIFFYVKSEKRVMYKTLVEEINILRDDYPTSFYWRDTKQKDNAKNKRRMKVTLLSTYNGSELDDETLREYGLPENKRPIEQPVNNKGTYKKLIDHIEKVFEQFDSASLYTEDLGSINCDDSGNSKPIRVWVNKYERDPNLRKKCIEKKGCKCSICGIDFGRKYGEIGDGFIHIHHIKPLASDGSDVLNNLIPVCPNCHAMLHRHMQGNARNVEDIIIHE